MEAARLRAATPVVRYGTCAARHRHSAVDWVADVAPLAVCHAGRRARCRAGCGRLRGAAARRAAGRARRRRSGATAAASGPGGAGRRARGGRQTRALPRSTGEPSFVRTVPARLRSSISPIRRDRGALRQARREARRGGGGALRGRSGPSATRHDRALRQPPPVSRRGGGRRRPAAGLRSVERRPCGDRGSPGRRRCGRRARGHPRARARASGRAPALRLPPSAVALRGAGRRDRRLGDARRVPQARRLRGRRSAAPALARHGPGAHRRPGAARRRRGRSPSITVRRVSTTSCRRSSSASCCSTPSSRRAFAPGSATRPCSARRSPRSSRRSESTPRRSNAASQPGLPVGRHRSRDGSLPAGSAAAHFVTAWAQAADDRAAPAD